jgi:hypothetical protein
MGEDLKVVGSKFSTLSWAVLLCVQLHNICKLRVENSIQVLSYKFDFDFVHGLLHLVDNPI